MGLKAADIRHHVHGRVPTFLTARGAVPKEPIVETSTTPVTTLGCSHVSYFSTLFKKERALVDQTQPRQMTGIDDRARWLPVQVELRAEQSLFYAWFEMGAGGRDVSVSRRLSLTPGQHEQRNPSQLYPTPDMKRLPNATGKTTDNGKTPTFMERRTKEVRIMRTGSSYASDFHSLVSHACLRFYF